MKAVRSGAGEWLATNDRGAIVKVGTSETAEAFSPGELLQLASALCAALSAEARLDHALTDPALSLTVRPSRVEAENRYSQIDTVVRTDLSGLDAEQLEHLRLRIDAAIDRSCTVGRTLHAGATTTFRLESNDEVR